MQCPRCDGQGTIHRASVDATGDIIQLCDECDAMWFDNEPVSVHTFQEFGTYMQSIGLRGLWQEITILLSE